LAHEIDAALARVSAGDDAHEANGGPHEAWSACTVTTISRAGSSGNNDERTAERSGRSGRVIQPWWNIVAHAAIRTGTNEEGDLQNEQRKPPDVWSISRTTADGRGPPVGNRPSGGQPTCANVASACTVRWERTSLDPSARRRTASLPGANGLARHHSPKGLK